MGEARTLKLRYTRNAAKELDEVLASISAMSPKGAQRVKDRIHDFLTMLTHQPLAGHATTRSPLRRIVVFPFPYLIFYSVGTNEIVVHGVRHAARRPLDS